MSVSLHIEPLSNAISGEPLTASISPKRREDFFLSEEKVEIASPFRRGRYC